MAQSVRSDERESLTHLFLEAALAAGGVVMRHYRNLSGVEVKSDNSPVTAADREAEAVILEHLAKGASRFPVVAEESVSAGRIPQLDGEAFILVDPIDGTKEFIQSRTDFTVNIALIDNGQPLLGVVFCPALETIYWSDGDKAWSGAVKAGEGVDAIADRKMLRVRPVPEKVTAVASRSHRDEKTDAFLSEKGITDCVSRGSSLKFCVVAEGEADIYPRFGPTMEWDIGAGHAVLSGAGGKVVREDGSAFVYGKQDAGFRNSAFIAYGGQ